MLTAARHASVHVRSLTQPLWRRHLLTLAIESSCDDTSVAILEKDQNACAKLHCHEKVTSDNLAYKGVHPIVALESHEQNLATLVNDALQSLPFQDTPAPSGSTVHVRGDVRQKPDFVTVTRGPGMRSNLSTGLNTAKGLAVAWQVPLVAVNHMQAHALTPRLVHALNSAEPAPSKPAFPFLSLLVSGGHTMLIRSQSLTEHPTLASTVDIAIGDCIDKIARHVLPQEVLDTSKSTMYGPILEQFAFPSGAADYKYTPPGSRQEEIMPRTSEYGWSITAPFAESRALKYSFVGIDSTVRRIVETAKQPMIIDERRALAKVAMQVAFEHLASRVVLALQQISPTSVRHTANSSINTLVISGGVAANAFLRHLLRAFLDVRGYSRIELVFPPLDLCTDNAAMIAWTGMEMFEAGYESELGCQALRKWSLDPNAADGGILGVPGWRKRG